MSTVRNNVRLLKRSGVAPLSADCFLCLEALDQWRLPANDLGPFGVKRMQGPSFPKGGPSAYVYAAFSDSSRKRAGLSLMSLSALQAKNGSREKSGD